MVGFGLPVTVPGTALRVWPTTGLPVMVAPEMVGVAGGAVTVAVAVLVALAAPAELVSVMVTEMVWPTSPAPTV